MLNYECRIFSDSLFKSVLNDFINNEKLLKFIDSLAHFAHLVQIYDNLIAKKIISSTELIYYTILLYLIKTFSVLQLLHDSTFQFLIF